MAEASERERFIPAAAAFGCASSGMNRQALGLNDGTTGSTFSVRVRVDDGHGHIVDCPATVLTLTNAAPSATLRNVGLVNEGSAAAVSFSDASDGSDADVAAGFRYTYALDPASLATTCSDAADGESTHFIFGDNGSYTVYGRILDKDGGYSTYSTVVIVNNISPSVEITHVGPAGVVAG
jgi:hypothetical protein